MAYRQHDFPIEVFAERMTQDAVVNVYGSLGGLPQGARALMRECGQQNLFLSDEWFELLIRHTGWDSKTLRIYTVMLRPEGPIDAVFVAASTSGNSWFARRQLTALTNFYTMNFGIILRPHAIRRQEIIEALAIAIATEHPKWDVLELRYLDSADPSTDLLITALRRAGMTVQPYFQFENWYQPMTGLSAKGYFDGRPSQLKNTIGRKERRLKRQHKFDICLYRAPNEVAQALEHYQAIYAASWKAPEQYPGFIPSLLRHCAERGTLRLGLLFVDDTPAAGQIWLVAGQHATIYKLAYDERYASFSVGSILTKFMFDSILDADGVAEVDFGVGSEPYKRDWMNNRRDVIGIVAFNNRTIGGLIGAGVSQIKKAGRRIVRRNVRA